MKFNPAGKEEARGGRGRRREGSRTSLIRGDTVQKLWEERVGRDGNGEVEVETDKGYANR